MAEPLNGCSALSNAAATAGKLVLIQRGGCDYSEKVYQGQLAGAVAAIVYNSGPGGIAAMRGGAHAADVTIPSIIIPYADGNAIKAAAEVSPHAICRRVCCMRVV